MLAPMLVLAAMLVDATTQENVPKNIAISFEYTNVSFWHAECPAWAADSNTLYWVDVLSQDIHTFDYDDYVHRQTHIGSGELNVLVPVEDSEKLLLAINSDLYLGDFRKNATKRLKFLARFDEGKPKNIINEGKADAVGRFWGGTKGAQRGDFVMPHQGALYKLEKPDYIPQLQLKNVTISNGLTWSLNDSVFYYTDSATKKIEAFDFNLMAGELSNRRTILDVKEAGFVTGIPDGMTIDRDGQLWVALMFAGTVARIDPDKQILTEIYDLPVSRPTSVTWAGEDLEKLIVTTSRRNMNAEEILKEPLAGAVLILHNLGTGGVPDNKFVVNESDRD